MEASLIRACSHETGTVNYPGVRVTSRSHDDSLSRGNIAPGQLLRIYLNSFISHKNCYIEFYTRLCISGAFWNFLLRNLFQTFIMSTRKTTLGATFEFCLPDMEKSYLGKAGYLVLYNG